MAHMLLELLSEEIPARMQAAAADHLLKSVTGALAARAIRHGAAKSFAGPRRLTLAIDDVSPSQPDRREEKRGPRVGAPEQAFEGFLRQSGLSREQVQVMDTDKGQFHVGVIEVKGRPTAEVLAEVIPEIIRTFPWPKSMRWGSGDLRWVRPLHAILCCLDREVVEVRIEGIAAGATTRGHRFHSQGLIEARDFEAYDQALRKAHVIVDAAERRAIILNDARKLAFAKGLTLIEDEALLDEIAGLVEWPVVLIGGFDPTFLDVPAEVLTTTMKVNQKYLALRNADGSLSPHFIVVANLDAKDGGKAIVAGNEKVLRARLSDARFFWEQDKKIKLADRLDALKPITFHAKLGSLYQRAERMQKLAGQIAGQLFPSDTTCFNQSLDAALLSKADLTSGMVGEFPELQGVMGRYYALNDGLPSTVADAIRDHYAPRGPSDAVPTAPVSVCVALAEKIDTLAGFFAIDEKPTGSKDPFALRRAALGIIRIILDDDLRLNLAPIFEQAVGAYGLGVDANAVANALIKFIIERLKVVIRDEGLRHDHFAAVVPTELATLDVGLIVRRARAVAQFLSSEDGTKLIEGYRRAANILKIEEQKDGITYYFADHPFLTKADLIHDRSKAYAALIQEDELVQTLMSMPVPLANDIDSERFEDAMRKLAGLRHSVDKFFEEVAVNVPDAYLRANRLRVLAGIREVMGLVADFSMIEGGVGKGQVS